MQASKQGSAIRRQQLKVVIPGGRKVLLNAEAARVPQPSAGASESYLVTLPAPCFNNCSMDGVNGKPLAVNLSKHVVQMSARLLKP